MDKSFREWYQAYINSDSWKSVRRARLKEDRYHCRACGTTENLHVHHLTYDRLTKERLSDLITVCKRCHQLIHREARVKKIPLDVATRRVVARLGGNSPQKMKRKSGGIKDDELCWCGKLIKGGHRHDAETSARKALPWEFSRRNSSKRKGK